MNHLRTSLVFNSFILSFILFIYLLYFILFIPSRDCCMFFFPKASKNAIPTFPEGFVEEKLSFFLSITTFFFCETRYHTITITLLYE